MLKNLDITAGQILRASTHVKRFNNAIRNPRQAQEEKLLQIIRANEDTVYGKKHGFSKIRSIKDFQTQVPANKYEDLHPYIEAVKSGQRNQLTAQQPFMFATTSGTTAQPKYIPITELHLKDYTHAFQVHNYQMIVDHPECAVGKFLIIASNDEEGHVDSGVPYGAVSGVLNKRQPSILKHHFSVPYELCKIKDVDMKYYLMLRIAMAQDVTAVVCCNPSSLLLLADQLKEHQSDLVSDLYDGTVRSQYAPPAHLADAFGRYLKPNRERAMQLQQLLERTGTLTPQLLWPNLSGLICWKGGPMSFYLQRLPEYFGDIPVRDFGYMASEGRGSIPLTNDGAGGVVALTSHFFEFVPEDDVDSVSRTFLTADQLEVGGRYYIHFTTNSGLYRYDINDLIEVVGKKENAPVIQFVRKGLGISSITGEKLTEEQVLVALNLAVRQLHLDEIAHFTAEVELGYPPHYVCFAELNASLPDSMKNEFIRIFDHSLKMQNPEYADKRSTKRLGMPELRTLPSGTYMRLRQQRVREGAPEAQVKIPLLSSPKSFSQRLASLEATY
ncbi:MAG TPA: GH3 auxin-responsive promoter family protein [Drouetiella sp.]